MFGKEIVKVTGNTCGHNYTVGDFYTLLQAQSTYHRLSPILPRVNQHGSTLPNDGNNIQSSDFIIVDAFTDEDLATFLKEKESLLLDSVITAVENAISFKEEVRKISDFGSKEEYMAARIKECKDSFTAEGISDDAQSKRILTLLATAA